MKARFRNILCVLGITGFILAAGVGFAQQQNGPPGDPEARKARMEARMQRIHAQLNLTPEQEQLLEVHRSEHREQAKIFHEAIRTAREELKTELQKQELDMAKINQLHSNLKDLHAKMEDHRLEGILDVRKILTPEQFVQFMELTGKGKRGSWQRMKQGPPEHPEEE